MQWISQVRTVALFAVLFWAAKLFAAGDKINTSYISTAPGSSTVIQVAKDARLFDKHGFDATVIFISGSVRGIQSILAGEIPIGEGGGPGLPARGSPAATLSPLPAMSMCSPTTSLPAPA
jgi:ABC-type nitrate/sulfonate/bicarbonate transport system substrate-binding protein